MAPTKKTATATTKPAAKNASPATTKSTKAVKAAAPAPKPEPVVEQEEEPEAEPAGLPAFGQPVAKTSEDGRCRCRLRIAGCESFFRCARTTTVGT